MINGLNGRHLMWCTWKMLSQSLTRLCTLSAIGDLVLVLIDVAMIFLDGPRKPVVRGPKEPLSPKEPHWLLIKGPSPLHDWAPAWDWALIGGPWHLERSHSSAWGLIRVPRKFPMATRHRRVRGPQGGPAEPRGCIGTRCTPLATTLLVLTKHNSHNAYNVTDFWRFGLYAEPSTTTKPISLIVALWTINHHLRLSAGSSFTQGIIVFILHTHSHCVF